MTRKMLLIAGVAGLALTSPAAADKGGNRGGDKPQQAAAQDGGEQAQRAERPQRQERQQTQRAEGPERPQRQERQQVQRQERPQQAERQTQRQERPQQAERQMQRMERPQRVERQMQRQERRVERPARIERQERRVERQERRIDREPQRVERQERRVERQQRVERQPQRDTFRPQQVERQQQRIERRAERNLAPFRDENRTATRLDRGDFTPQAALNPVRDMRPMKPFKAKFDDRRALTIGDRIRDTQSWSPVPAYVANNYVDTRDFYYRYDDDFGSIYRINRNDGYIASQYPLFGGYGIGDPWPATYYSSYVPLGYRDLYYDTPDYYYRNDGYGIYQVDSSTQLITALVALLGGQGFGIGQTLPASYGAYNLPLDYRASYQDSDDSYYRYGDGFIYQVDPGSRRIAARYPLYTDDYYVGEAWPSAYPDYNVPYGYQSTYYDTPQYQYRYADGGIYQVDPNNQMILALVALLSGDQFAVGQAMPAGYGMYNVPLDYRDRYADSDNEWYRYANGNVYQVDPRSGLIEEAYPIYT